MMAAKESNRGKDLLKNTGIIGFGTMCTKALTFLLLPLYTALLSTSDYGTFDLVTTIGTLLVPIVHLQLSQAIFRFAAEARGDEDNMASILTAVYIESGVLALIYAVAFFVAAPFITLPYKWVLLPYVLVNVALQLALYTARGIGDNVTYALGSFVSASLTVVLNVVLLVGFSMGVDGMMLSCCLGPLFGTGVISLRTCPWRYFRPSLWSVTRARDLTRYALPLMPNEISWWALQSADRVIVATVLGTAANGLISVANKFSTIYSTVFSVFNASWTEQVILHYRDEDGRDFIRQTVDVTVRFFSALFLLILAVMPFLWPLMVNVKFSDAYGLVPFYMVAVYANLFTGLVSPIYLVNNESRKVMEATIVSAVASVVSLVILMGPLGVYAAPVSTIVGYGLVAVMRVVDIERRHMHIGLDANVLVLTFVLAGATTVSYFIGGVVTNCICFGLCLTFSAAINRSSAIALIGEFKDRKKHV